MKNSILGFLAAFCFQMPAAFVFAVDVEVVPQLPGTQISDRVVSQVSSFTGTGSVDTKGIDETNGGPNEWVLNTRVEEPLGSPVLIVSGDWNVDNTENAFLFDASNLNVDIPGTNTVGVGRNDGDLLVKVNECVRYTIVGSHIGSSTSGALSRISSGFRDVTQFVGNGFPFNLWRQITNSNVVSSVNWRYLNAGDSYNQLDGSVRRENLTGSLSGILIPGRSYNFYNTSTFNSAEAANLSTNYSLLLERLPADFSVGNFSKLTASHTFVDGTESFLSGFRLSEYSVVVLRHSSGAGVDPRLELLNNNLSLITSNDDWEIYNRDQIGGGPVPFSTEGIQEIVDSFNQVSVTPPMPGSSDAVLVAGLRPGSYYLRSASEAGTGSSLTELISLTNCVLTDTLSIRGISSAGSLVSEFSLSGTSAKAIAINEDSGLGGSFELRQSGALLAASVDGAISIDLAPGDYSIHPTGPDGEYIFNISGGGVVYTPTGTNVEVVPETLDEEGQPVEGAPEVGVVFDSVTEGGETTVTATTEVPEGVPEGFKLGNPPLYVDIETTATFEGSIMVCIDYSGIDFQGNPNNLKLAHYEDGSWVTLENMTNDTTAQIICGTTTTLSPFTVVEPDPENAIDDLLELLGAIEVSDGILQSLSNAIVTVETKLDDANLNNNVAAINALNAFMNSVDGKSGNQIDEADALALISAAQEVLSFVEGTAEF